MELQEFVGRFKWNVVSPMINRFKWNVDGTSIRKPGPSEIDGVLRNHHGILLGNFFFVS
jgi:hypothetical protein